jgi:protein ImuA
VDRASHLHALRQAVAAFTEPSFARAGRPVAFGASGPDEALDGGLSRGAVHEIVAATGADASAALGFALALGLRAAREEEGITRRRTVRRQPILWLREKLCEIETGKLYPPAIAEMGLAPERLVHVRLADTKALLRAAAEAAQCGALGALVVEPWGNPAVLDLTAMRRLSLKTEESGVPLFLVRPHGQPGPGAVETRWQVAAAPSRALEANAPGHPVFDIQLLRRRGGRDGLSWRLEWNSDRQCFAEEALLRPVVSAPADRPARPAGAGAWRRAG